MVLRRKLRSCGAYTVGRLCSSNNCCHCLCWILRWWIRTKGEADTKMPLERDFRRNRCLSMTISFASYFSLVFLFSFCSISCGERNAIDGMLNGVRIQSICAIVFFYAGNAYSRISTEQEQRTNYFFLYFLLPLLRIAFGTRFIFNWPFRRRFVAIAIAEVHFALISNTWYC